MTVPMSPITAKEQKQDIKQESGRNTSTTCRIPTQQHQYCEYNIGKQDNTQEGQVKVTESQGILPWDGAQT